MPTFTVSAAAAGWASDASRRRPERIVARGRLKTWPQMLRNSPPPARSCARWGGVGGGGNGLGAFDSLVACGESAPPPLTPPHRAEARGEGNLDSECEQPRSDQALPSPRPS